MFLKIQDVLSWLFFINAIVSIIIIILERKRPEKTIAWLLVFVVLPPVGLILYIFLGRNWKRHKLSEEFSPTVKELIYRVINRIDNPDYIQLIQLLGNISDSPLFVENDIKLFSDGEEKFKYLLDEMAKAKHHIHLEYYIVKDDKIGNKVKEMLIKKAKEGVRVRFLMDRVGSIKVGRRYIKELKEAGVDVIQYSYFLAPLLRHINTQINYRNHRKIAIIDGRVGFIGGMNIGDEYLGKGKLGYWRDMHIMIKGDGVLGLQAVFLDDFWAIKRIDDSSFFYDEEFEKYFPAVGNPRKKVMQIIKSGPDSEYPSIMQTMIKMITMAKKNIYITTPYFVPTESIMETLKIAALSGVKVKILFPGRYDHIMVYYASRTYLAELMKCGAEVYFYKDDAFVHSKHITIDGKIATIGTANMDIRSYELNYEVNAVIYDEDFTQRLDEIFINDLKESRKYSVEDYERTPKITRFMEAAARVFSSLL
ncbi:cardiolipin synthase [Fervidicella metallireducens AeB]|uniref:Cardiolipin synthase n=1 Tax=Fervidicella metallireducens AeB TaxID=1403537 RepID=A0A017RV23_9CLOT|nr:cardiolipin synthase [Fervidicella metallireducens]EYE88512.1 cardiolipin synthase [Fervidicella metallireducens AeB]